jgi:DNA-binding NarL/FixJ family response regulator
MDSDNHILIVARPGIMRNSLLSYLRAIPSVQSILLANDVETALQAIRVSNPKLIVMDSDLTEQEMFSLAGRVRTEHPNIKLILLVESIRQQKQSLDLGVHYALLKGFLDEPLRHAVQDAMREIGQNERQND